MDIQIEKNRAIARGAKSISAFSGGVPPMELQTIAKGDLITIPADWNQNIFEQKIRNSDQVAEFVLLKAMRNGQEVPVQFYPGFFTKNREVAGPNAEHTGERKMASGTAVDFVQQYATFNDAFAAMVGKTIEVTDLVKFKTFRYGSEATQNAWVPVLNFK